MAGKSSLTWRITVNWNASLPGCANPGSRSPTWSSTARISSRCSWSSRLDELRLMGFSTLFRKELLRFLKVSVQTVAAPVLTSALYLVIFGQVLEGRLQVFDGVRYI